jgi:hypothetical protein
VELLELFAVLALTSTFTMLCSCSNFDGSEAYFVSSLCHNDMNKNEVRAEEVFLHSSIFLVDV